jgi:hypothetical protein
VLSHNLVQWEILQRPMSGTSRISPPPHQTESVRTAPSRQADIMNTAYWRLLKGLTTLAMACGSEFHSWAEEDGMMEVEARALRAERASSSELAPWQEVLCWLMPREQPAAPPATPPIGVHTALCPRLKYDCRPGADSHRGPGLGPSGSTFPQPLKLHWPHIMGDPYALLMEVLALMMSTVCPREVVDPRAPTWVAPAGALAALLPVVYTIAVNQAAMLAVAICSTYDLTDSCGDPTSVFGFLMRELKRYLNEDQDRGGPGGHARLMEAIAVQVFPFLQRVTGLWALVTDGLEPKSAAPGAAGEDGTAGYLGVVEGMAAALGLPSLAAALEVPNRHANPPVLLSHWCRRLAQQLPTISERALWLTRSRMSIPRTLRRPGLLPLPQLYHHLFLALGKCVCDVCGKPPKDPALCLSTGNFLCCDSHSGCLNHAWEHGAGTGIFLLIKVCVMFVHLPCSHDIPATSFSTYNHKCRHTTHTDRHTHAHAQCVLLMVQFRTDLLFVASDVFLYVNVADDAAVSHPERRPGLQQPPQPLPIPGRARGGGPLDGSRPPAAPQPPPLPSGGFSVERRCDGLRHGHHVCLLQAAGPKPPPHNAPRAPLSRPPQPSFPFPPASPVLLR